MRNLNRRKIVELNEKHRVKNELKNYVVKMARKLCIKYVKITQGYMSDRMIKLYEIV